MKLLKELTQVREAHISDVDVFHKKMTSLEEKITPLELAFENDSQLQKAIEAVGGDISYFKDAQKALDRFRDAFDELHKYTEMATHRD